jgi:hypothetical protein
MLTGRLTLTCHGLLVTVSFGSFVFLPKQKPDGKVRKMFDRMLSFFRKVLRYDVIDRHTVLIATWQNEKIAGCHLHWPTTD